MSIRWRGEQGAASNSLVQLLVMLAVVGLVAYEAVALGVGYVSVDNAAREVAREARDEYRAEQSLDQVRATAEDAARDHSATVVTLETHDDELSVTLEKGANTLVVHRIGPLADRWTPTATRTAPLRR